MKPIPKLLSKSKIMRGYRCLKSIYYTIHRPELEPKPDAATQQKFDQGNAVGEKAREYYPGGVLVDCKPWEFGESLKKTRELLAAGTQFIYEAAFEYKGCYARADILKYNPATQRWSLIEVKSSTKVKDEYIEDVGLQAWIIANSGIKLEKISILHLNRECRFPDLSNLFIEVDVTERLREHHREIAPKLNFIFKAIRQGEEPEQDIGPQCSKYGRECEFIETCWSARGIPEASVFNIPGLRERAWDFYKRGQIRFEDLDSSELDEIQQRIVKAHVTGDRYIDRVGLKKAMTDWKYPLVFLDFESINPAIPRYPRTSPYQQVPFQFSVHILREPGGQLEHFEYLHEDVSDPRPTLIPKLLAACGHEGSIVAYYAQFESARINELAEFSEEQREALLALNERMVDPLPVVRDTIYDVGFNGSFSLKVVAPSLIGEHFSYDGMNVADGTQAQIAFLNLISPEFKGDRSALRTAMLEYCRKDTMAMVECVREMFALAR